MPRLRKLIFHGNVHLITCSVEEGIMLPANFLTNFLVTSAMARAMLHHPITISHFLVSGTHLHMLVRVEDPEDIPGFMERFKTETAHYLNKILGRKKRTIWCARYDSPMLDSINKVIEYISYIYTNPAKDRLTHSIDQYPGLSSWDLFRGTKKRLYGRLISRDSLFPVDQSNGSLGFKRVVRKLAKNAGKLRELHISPNDWMKAFDITEAEEVHRINRCIVEAVTAYSQQEPCIGAERLRNQGIDLGYKPQREGKMMWVLSDDPDRRKEYIQYLKTIVEAAAYVYQEWKRGNLIPMPAGVFAPPLPVVLNLLA